MPDKVSCTVSNCEYWSEGNMCHAPSILVAAGAPRDDWDEHGERHEDYDETPVNAKQDSYCFTFEKVEVREKVPA